jgi:hypothetical protein
LQRVNDPRLSALGEVAIKEMKKAVTNLNEAANSSTRLADALAAEQAAYQALLKLQEHEYQVMRNRRQNQQGGGGRDRQMQRQLDQLDLANSEDRYETQRQAQRPQNSQRREQLQIQSRLQELARRQQDLNDRMKELQAALQEARTEQEREEIRRRLKRLQEEEQQMLADVDEVRQRMDRPENQSQLADERRQLEQTRQDIQKASESLGQDSPSQALASGTRAQRQLQQLRDQMRKENSSQFADDLREMRAQARDLARQQEEILKKMNPEAADGRKSLADAPETKDVPESLSRQREHLTNLLDRATSVSQQAEESEPLLSRQLYDTVRKFSQGSGKSVKDLQEQLLNRGLMTRSLLERLKESSEPDGAKLLDLSSEMFKQDQLAQASEAGQRARAELDDLKRGVERAAESVLGDDTEALRLAQQELNRLTDELAREAGQPTNSASSERGTPAARDQSQPGEQASQSANARQGNEQSANSTSQREGSTPREQTEPGNQAAREGNSQQPNDQSGNSSSSQAQQENGQSNQSQSQAQNGGAQPNQGQPGQREQTSSSPRDGVQPGGARAGAGGARNYSNWGENRAGGAVWRDDFDRFLNEGPYYSGPLTGTDFVPWSDRLRDVEEMVEIPDLRNEIAAARERARLMRQEFKRDKKKPEWAAVKTQVLRPLVEVRERIAEELARRESADALVPIDRDPVPDRYSELVRRYYEKLGKDK